MKPLGVTATLVIGKHRVITCDWPQAMEKAKTIMAMRSLNAPEYAVAMVAVGFYTLVKEAGRLTK